MDSTLPEISRFSGLAEFQAAVLQLLQDAGQSGCKHLIWCDPDFALWPLADRELLAALEAWSGREQQLTLIAKHYRHIEQHYPRFVQWRRHWDHIVHAYTAAPSHQNSLPRCLLALPDKALQLIDPDRCRGVLLHQGQLVRPLRESLDEILYKAQTAFPASTLGL